MKRKIIGQGNKSYTLTLPIGWIKEERLKAGDDVELEIEDNNLIVSPVFPSNLSQDTCSIDVSDLNERGISRIINHAYRKGYDIIHIKSKNPKHIDYVNAFVRGILIGFEVVRQSKDSCIIENIAEPSHDKYESIQKKIFYIMKIESEKVYSGFINKKFQSVKETEETKKMLDSYTNLCRRLIIKYKIGGQKNSPLLMVLISRMVLISHAYANLYKLGVSNKNFTSSEQTLKLFHEVNKALQFFIDVQSKKDLKKINDLHDMMDGIYFEKLPLLLQKSKGLDSVVIFYVGEIARNIMMEANLLFGLSISTAKVPPEQLLSE